MTKLRTHVHVTDDSGAVHVFGPADEVPEWAQALITNPKAWQDPPTPAAPPAKKAAPARRAAPRRKAGGGDAAVSDG